MRHLLIAFSLLLCPVTPALADVGIGFSVPGIEIGINVPVRVYRQPPAYFRGWRAIAALPAAVFGRSLSARGGTAAFDSIRELPLPAA